MWQIRDEVIEQLTDSCLLEPEGPIYIEVGLFTAEDRRALAATFRTVSLHDAFKDWAFPPQKEMHDTHS